ncbi:6-phosphogluconolactonase [Actinokineospora cianjurensis]|uniref:6-phosphogluconolactonase n=1 Tax=Actinokineospora cianjurensis TaxID=585224 RepID=A0A421B4B6_9PSEU|nr:6-phosphogluconolactonase [Actinokineospora cianjurensis]RLK59276.1 6-phosphogluconolactonase [Actinokineospora cianjurensis]
MNRVIVYTDPPLLASATAARLVTAITDLQATQPSVAIALTGGRTGTAVLEHLRVNTAATAIDWSTVDIFWGDERFLPGKHPDRNETQARAALLDHIKIPKGRIHAVAPSDGPYGDDAELAAAAYAKELDGVTLDILLAGVGEEGHTLSVFPDSPAVHETEATVVAVRDCPKPPPVRISLTLPAARQASQVWLMTTGTSKAEAVTTALSGASEVDLPAAGAQGRELTLWLLDKAAAGR